jgi:pimeloyl-ACP methyl ester carboxylesterase
VVLAGHSQGSVIALAAAVIQPEDTRRRLALITVGCVLDRLYSRVVPRSFGPELYRMAAVLLGGAAAGSLAGAGPGCRWTNIWRHSDYLGGSVPYPPAGTTDGPVNVRSTDPVFDAPAGDTIPPAAGRHSDFWADPAFASAVDRLTRRVGGDRRGSDLSPAAAR